MKNINIRIGSLLVLLAIGLFSACKKDDPDTIAPTGTFTTPVADAEFYRGHSLVCNAIFNDNEDLSHVEASIMSLKGFDTPWEASERIALSGTSYKLSSYELFEGAIPMEIMSGTYVLNFKVYDKAQNKRTYSINIVIN